ncbi:MAG: response regulator transcription factor [Anaerolineae bacterium]|nr:response regulator transcription factor [Anaerolineae bacterium]
MEPTERRRWHVLVVDDEPEILGYLKRGLTFEGFEVSTAPDGEAALALAERDPPDLVILDVMLPGIDGLAVCEKLRQQDASLPILMLTARDSVPDRVAGLDSGADDYLVKPFAFIELLARIHALLRRASRRREEPQALRYADVVLDPQARLVERAGRPIALTAREFDLLELLMRHPNQVLTRNVILENIWGYHDDIPESNIVDVYVRYLRNKLAAAGKSRLIQTVRGLGYVLREE